MTKATIDDVGAFTTQNQTNANANFTEIYAAVKDGTGNISTNNLTIAGTFTRTGGSTPQAPVAVGAATTAAVSQSGKTFLLDTASGSVLTLPAATGSGAVFEVVVKTTTTSGAHKILAASSSDFINGIAIGFTGSTAKVFASAAATNHSIQMPFSGSQPSGGFIGDVISIRDVAANLWNMDMRYQAGTTPTTPYSASTS